MSVTKAKPPVICGTCGYNLSSLASTAACPECGCSARAPRLPGRIVRSLGSAAGWTASAIWLGAAIVVGQAVAAASGLVVTGRALWATSLLYILPGVLLWVAAPLWGRGRFILAGGGPVRFVRVFSWLACVGAVLRILDLAVTSAAEATGVALWRSPLGLIWSSVFAVCLSVGLWGLLLSAAGVARLIGRQDLAASLVGAGSLLAICSWLYVGQWWLTKFGVWPRGVLEARDTRFEVLLAALMAAIPLGILLGAVASGLRLLSLRRSLREYAKTPAVTA